MSTLPSHHLPNGKGFTNPWPSFKWNTFTDSLKMIKDYKYSQAAVPKEGKVVQVEKPDWDLHAAESKKTSKEIIGVTWLGHASFLLQLKDINIITDPIFSDRCSPVSFLGPKRYTPPPCKVQELPPIDIVLISHNHYDHCDEATLKEIFKNNPNVMFAVPLKNRKLITSFGIPEKQVIEKDWWESLTYKNTEFVCTPNQHFSARGVLDRFEMLWSSWSVLSSKGTKIFFAGDTGYRSVPRDFQGDIKTLPFCPAFKQIGEKYGPFHLSLLPIGAYSPRPFMSPIHCNPADAVDLHKDIKSMKSIGMHYGTFVLTDEPVTEPPNLLKAELVKAGLPETGVFDTIPVGKTILYPI